MHYARLRRLGTFEVQRVQGGPPADRFWSKIIRGATKDDCWGWSGSLFRPSGYAQFHLSGGSVLAHRYAYELLIGPIPEGHQIDHVYERGCRSRACCNPRHLEAVTCAENIARRHRASSSSRADLVAEVQRLREENAVLRARLGE